MGCPTTDTPDLGVDGTVSEVRLDPEPPPAPPRRRRNVAGVVALAVAAAAVVLTAALFGSALGLFGTDDTESVFGPTEVDGIPRPAAMPPELLAAENYAASPTSRNLRELFIVLGGFEGLSVGEVTGSFDLVTFDPADPDRLLATMRDGYGPARNNGLNQQWTVDATGIRQEPWRADTPHDFVHFNPDGTHTMWELAGSGDEPWPQRRAHVIAADGTVIATTAPMYPARFATDGGRVFALVTAGTSLTYTTLVASDGDGMAELDSGLPYSWVDVPVPGIVVAYPRSVDLRTRVWDTVTLLPLDDHPLAGRRWQRADLSHDGSVAVGIRFDGRIEVVDVETGTVTGEFGLVNPRDVHQPVTIDPGARMVTTIDNDGTLTLWHLDDGRLVARTRGDSGVLRWVNRALSARLSSAVAFDGSRVALRQPAGPETRVVWSIVDTDVSSWIDRACARAGRRLTVQERADLGPPPGVTACGL